MDIYYDLNQEWTKLIEQAVDNNEELKDSGTSGSISKSLFL